MNEAKVEFIINNFEFIVSLESGLICKPRAESNYDLFFFFENNEIFWERISWYVLMVAMISRNPLGYRRANHKVYKND